MGRGPGGDRDGDRDSRPLWQCPARVALPALKEGAVAGRDFWVPRARQGKLSLLEVRVNGVREMFSEWGTDISHSAAPCFRNVTFSLGASPWLRAAL